MIKHIFLILATIFSIDCYAQSIEDSIHAETLLKTVVSFEQTNIDSALVYVEDAYKIAHNGKSEFLMSKTALRLGVVYQNISNYKKATENYKEGVKLAEHMNNKKLLAQGYNCLGNLFGLQKQLSQASEYFNKALVISKEINDVRKVAVILSNLANIEYSKAYVSNDYTTCNLVYK